MRYLARLVIILCCASAPLSAQPKPTDECEGKTIKSIILEGVVHVPQHTVRHHIPYTVGQKFTGSKTRTTLENLSQLGFFNTCTLSYEPVEDGISLIVTVTEKPLLGHVTIEGNKSLTTDKILEAIGRETLHTIDEEAMRVTIHKVEEAYKKAHYHHAHVTARTTPDTINPGVHNLILSIDENTQSTLQKIIIEGNNALSGREIRSVMLSSEAWLLGILTGAGSYNPEMLEGDRYLIGQHYRSKGYYTARVSDIQADFSPDKKLITLTYSVEEGDQFTLSDISIAPDPDGEFNFVALEQSLPLKAGDIYNEQKVRSIMEELSSLCGSQGYIDADVQPHIIPDLEKKTVSVRFVIDKGKKWKLRRLTITGNLITQDHVIRRNILLEEGDTVTAHLLEASKRRVTQLSYFEQDGVNWKKHYKDNNNLDLELNVQESRPRNFSFQLAFSGTEQDPGGSLKGVVDCTWNNIKGSGRDGIVKLEGNFKQLHQFVLQFSDPRFWETNTALSVELARRSRSYDHMRSVTRIPKEVVWTSAVRAGIPIPGSFTTSVVTGAGFEYILNNNTNGTAIAPNNSVPHELRPVMQRKLTSMFTPGILWWFEGELSNDTLNHKVYPSDGYRLSVHLKSAPPLINQTFTFLKGELSASWYTELLDQQRLVLGLHAKAGWVSSLGNSTSMPFKEAFILGGPGSVRGFDWGTVGPVWYGTVLGGTKMLQCNAELIFPLLKENGLYGHFFYDSGTAWDCEKQGLTEVQQRSILNDTFRMRHTVGFGINMLWPQPIKVSFGYKLDFDKRSGEAPSKFEIMANTAF